jgi:tetratricopeptide (TPR) repeat protein
LLIIITCAAFGRIAGNDFINYDDNEYITENSNIKSGINAENIKWAFSVFVSKNWHPLTLISHMLDWSFFGANASGHHLVSLLLHIGAVIFLFLFLYKTTNNIWPSAFAAAIFALHPLRVESVAWIAERKDVLSMFFGIACLWAYAFYVELPKLSRYLLCLILFALALMSKPMLVTLPFILMLLDYWPLNRWGKALFAPMESRHQLTSRLVWEKVPFILLTIVFSILTFWAQNKGNAVTSIDRLHFSVRLDNAIVSYMAYLEKIFWPVNLAVFYPYETSFSLWKVLISGIIILLITLAVLYYIKKLPFLFVGWFWYLGTLIPVIGLVQVGSQAMADRHTYLPSIGIAVGLAWVIPFMIKKEEMHKKVLFPAACAAIILLAVLTWNQCGYWKNSIKLWSHALRVTKDNYLAHNNRGAAYATLDHYRLAILDYNEAIRLKPDYADALNNRGTAYANLNQYMMAIADLDKGIHLNPDAVAAYNNRGTAYAKLGKYQSAILDYNKSIILKDYAYAYNNRGLAYIGLHDTSLGCRDLQKACIRGDCKYFKWAKGKGICQ